MKVWELVRALEMRAMDREKVVVVEVGKGGRIEVDGVRLGRELITLTLWKPPGTEPR